MNLIINGEQKIINANSQVANLAIVIKELGFNPKLIVVEFNGLILSPQVWETQEVRDGDILEIVTIVGGGC
ncbi:MULTISPECIES: sulfur carrier protein ThiS [Prochlorococcus]|uniref:Sulfur transfer protein n=1 Tax=Prochlorococcus marinus (strain SARG / CCMP1375 / SS120) TaxID=167539 RepID=Q7VAV4_PROMA|nr:MULTISPECIES: sulfur carrier protein ThiS [Prochlorococcus]AAQ00393.1 Sulfur transfer protein [Prochlorococcus marinus subsp. marinus str. CCMP1375]KGG14274.1 Sulfur carrier protein ThiS [Prochlorococcus marinus str. LG]KGG22153.1 Sulfur carrier protein ThiS [Prochlorococcus marinus str. SS2]KGG24529.1 Sulfur carrier protein ThiS [Prochlorococcus marinus str. SS35]KGG33424.1 Sulfur carrier protein ThiS [Prochlorococcus marinus str. SS51]